MMKLIRLEWKKNDILKYIRNAVITTAALLVFIQIGRASCRERVSASV